MVKVVFYKSGNNYYGFREYGHAGFDEAGKDIVCAALSAMTMLIINTIEVVWGANVDFEMDEKTADISVKVKSALPMRKTKLSSMRFRGLFIATICS